MRVKMTAEIIDDDGTVIGRRTSEAEGIPAAETFDLSTREGFLRDFDALERAVLQARNEIGEEIAEEILEAASKKRGSTGKNGRGRIGIRPDPSGFV